MNSRLLLLSNSTNPGEPYLGWPEPHIKDFLGAQVKKILFIPYAGVTITFNEYYQSVSSQLVKYGFEVESIHKIAIEDGLLDRFDAILIAIPFLFIFLSIIF